TEFPKTVLGKFTIQTSDTGGATTTLALDRFQRPVLRAEIDLLKTNPDGTIDRTPAIVLVAHLKSKRGMFMTGEDDKDQTIKAIASARSLVARAAEAAALRALVVEETKDTTKPVIVIGDLNDDISSVTTQMIAGESGFDTILYSVHDLQEQQSLRAVNYSHVYNGRYELLDHILVSEELVARNPKHIAKVRFTRVLNDHLFDFRLVDRNDPRQKTSPTSDHGIPVTEFEWK
ncbi:MAG: endonuclease/exonuclease/phosphatase family protein, partial [Kofleriaceae bacterium]